LIDVTLEGGGKLYACTTTMGVMGNTPQDFMDGVECLGAAAFLEFASEADVALFI
jgi:peroxiredoxin family protein